MFANEWTLTALENLEKSLASPKFKILLLNRLEGGISGISEEKVRAFMSLFRDSSYTQTYPSGSVTLPVGSPLYVEVSVEERNPRFVVVLEDCYFTGSSNPDDHVRRSIIQNK